MTADRLEFLFTESKLSFHRYGTSIGEFTIQLLIYDVIMLA